MDILIETMSPTPTISLTFGLNKRQKKRTDWRLSLKFLNKCGNLIYGYSIKTPFLCRVKVKQIYLTLQICWGT
jgi:hypothetical protein